MSSQEGEPPRKKRRSKWDIQPEDLTTAHSNHDSTPPQAPTSAAAAAAAKLNAKLASEGKIKPASTVYMPASSSVLSPSPNSLASSLLPPSHGSATTVVGNMGPASATIDINDLDVREQLTRPASLTDINKTTGVVVAVRGKLLSLEEKRQNSSDTPLHIHIQGPTKDKVDMAVMYINSLIRSLQQVAAKGGGALLATPPIPQLPVTPSQHSSGDKVFVGLDKVSEEFKVKERIEGIGGSFLGHIASQTGAKVYLRGRGSGFTEPTSGRESFEAMYIYISHATQDGLTAARKLCESLIQTVQKDHDTWKRTQQPLGFGGQAPPYRPTYLNPYHQGGYPQVPLGPMPPGGGPNFGPPPPGAFAPPPPPPGYGFYPGPPMPPSQYPPGPAGPYGPPPPAGFGPPPPEFQQPRGPPYQPFVPMPSPSPSVIDGLTYTTSEQLPQPTEREGGGSHLLTPVTGSSAAPATAAVPGKRRFTEQVPSSNGTSQATTAESGPYWCQMAQPRRFTEGSLDDKQDTTETKSNSDQSDNQKDEQQRADDGDGNVRNDSSNFGVSTKDGLEDTKLMPPPPPPPGSTLQTSAVPTMPPPSFLPARATLPSSAKSNEKLEVRKSPLPLSVSPPLSSSPKLSPSPALTSSAPTLKPPATPPLSHSTTSTPATLPLTTTGPLVAYGDDSDSDADS